MYEQEKQYKQTSSVDQLAIHFALDGNMIHKESDEAKDKEQDWVFQMVSLNII